VVKYRKIWYFDLDLWPMTLKFTWILILIFWRLLLHVHAKFRQDRSRCSGSLSYHSNREKRTETMALKTTLSLLPRTLVSRHECSLGLNWPRRLVAADGDAWWCSLAESIVKRRTDTERTYTMSTAASLHHPSRCCCCCCWRCSCKLNRSLHRLWF